MFVTVRAADRLPQARGSTAGHLFCHAVRAMDDVRAELQSAEDEARQQAASLRQRARRLRLRGFPGLADELEADGFSDDETIPRIF